MPKKIEINVADFFGKDLYLPEGAPYEIEASQEETIDKLNTVSDTISEMARNYKEEKREEDSKEKDEKEIFIENVIDKLDTIKENALYDDLVDEDNGILSDIFDILEKKNNLEKNDIVKLFEDRHEYILGFEDFETNRKVEEDITKATRLISDTYKILKLNELWKKRIDENKKVISSQLNGVSKAISDVARSINKTKSGNFEDEMQEVMILCKQKNIEVLDINIAQNKNGRFAAYVYIPVCKDEEECRTYEIENILTEVLKEKIVLQKEVCGLKSGQNVCKQMYVSKDKFIIQTGIAKECKTGYTVSGDSYVQTTLDDGKYLVAISDGMGSGIPANEASSSAVKMLERMLSSGFDKDTSLELINSSMYINAKEDSYATLDVAIFDLYMGNMEFMKNGACPTFIKNKKNVSIVKSVSLPARNT